MKKDEAKISVEGWDYLQGELVSHTKEEKEFSPQWDDDIKINHKQEQEESNFRQKSPHSTERKVENVYKMKNGEYVEVGKVVMPDPNKPKPSVETWTYVDGHCVSHDVREADPTWHKEAEDPIYQSMLKNISIGGMHHSYLNTNEIQDKEYEYIKICKFLTMFANDYAKKKGLSIDDVKLEFINYGKTQLVYVLTEKSGERMTLLVKQPAIAFGKVLQEGNNLTKLQKTDKNVVAPVDYFSYGELELYVTPYINQARCVASDGGCWGMYIPEPYYRFETFTKVQSDIVTTCMIAKLVSLYDFEKQEGISACKLGGGDFMLPKGWEKETPSIKSTLDNLYLIAAREKINCSFEEYLNLVRKEFSIPTIHLDQETLVLNHRARAKIAEENIENGITLGKQLIAQHEKNK